MSSSMDLSGAPASKRVYIGNLPYHATSQDIETYLTEAGFDIERLDISVDPFTGKNPSYCFVELFTAEQAQRALSELPGASFMGRPLRVNVHIPKRRDGTALGGNSSSSSRASPFGSSDREAGTQSPATPARTFGNDWRTPSSNNGSRFTPRESNGNGENGGSATRPFMGRFNSSSRNAEASPVSSQQFTPSQGGRRVYVGNLPSFETQELLESELRTIFADFAVESISKLITGNPREDDDSGLHHYCFVDLVDADQAQAAIQALDGSAMAWNGTLRVNVAKDRKVFERRAGEASPAPVGAAEKPVVEKPFRDLGSLSSWRRAN